MSSSLANRGLFRLLVCAGVMTAAGCAAGDVETEEDGARAETQAQIVGVSRDPRDPGGVSRNPGTSTPPPRTGTQPPATTKPQDGSPAVVKGTTRCTNLNGRELATCRQNWADLPGGMALLNLGGGVRPVNYKLVGVGNRTAYILGDIILGDEASVLQADGLEAAARISTGVLWKNGVVPYEIDASLPEPSRVTQALAAWEAKTAVRFVARTTETDYVSFIDGDGCSSYVGRTGGMQPVQLNAGCSVPNAIHEVGHVLGLWHEQSRLDRDNFVEIHWDNISAGNEHNFDTIAKQEFSGNVLDYDFASIMHYGAYAFAADPSKPTITVRPGITLPPGVVIGQRSGLSPGDIRAVSLIYCYNFGGALCN